jgi:hypothetical protein
VGASINEFLANFSGGGARPNRYSVILTFPTGVPNAIAASTKAGFTCKATSIPGSNMGVIDLPYKGRQAKVPGDKVFDDWNVTIMIDNDFATRDVFETWHDLILGFESNVANENMVNPANCFARAEVRQLDRADRVIKTYFVESIFPSQVSEIQLAWDANDQVMEQNVSFAINGWKSNAIA